MMKNPSKGAASVRRAGPAIGLGVGAAIGLIAMPFFTAKALVVGVAIALGVFIGMAADRSLSSRERLIGAASALVVIGIAALLGFLRN